MQKNDIYARKVHRSSWLVVTLLVLSVSLFSNADGHTYFELLTQPRTTVSSPPVVLRVGTAGNSTIYTNSTSAKISAVASPTLSYYDYVLTVANNVSDPWQIRLNAYPQSDIERLNNCTIYFHSASDGFSDQVDIMNSAYTQPIGPWYDLLASPAETYIAVVLQASSGGVSQVNVYLEIRVPGTTTYAQYVLTFEFT